MSVDGEKPAEAQPAPPDDDRDPQATPPASAEPSPTPNASTPQPPTAKKPISRRPSEFDEERAEMRRELDEMRREATSWNYDAEQERRVEREVEQVRMRLGLRGRRR